MNLCLICKKEIPYLDRRGQQPKVCCEDHRRLLGNKRSAIWKIEHPEKRWMPQVPQRKCLICHELFSPKNKSQKLCSHACFGKYGGGKNKKPLPICELCGKPVKRLRRRFCSRDCKTEWYRGKEVYNYAGGQARDHYASAFWLALAEKIRERDRVCQHCGKAPKSGTKLHVHHIHPWRYSKNDNPDNLQALCPSCHKKADSKLGC